MRSRSRGASVGRKNDPRPFFVRPVEHADIADALHETAAGLRGEARTNRVTLLAIADARADFHEFMSGEGAVELLGHARREARGADENDRLAAVRERAQMFALFFG